MHCPSIDNDWFQKRDDKYLISDQIDHVMGEVSDVVLLCNRICNYYEISISLIIIALASFGTFIPQNLHM